MLSIRQLCNEASDTTTTSASPYQQRYQSPPSPPVTPLLAQAPSFGRLTLNSGNNMTAIAPKPRFTLEQKWHIVQELKLTRCSQSKLALKYHTSQENVSRWNSLLKGCATLADAKMHKHAGKGQTYQFTEAISRSELFQTGFSSFRNMQMDSFDELRRS